MRNNPYPRNRALGGRANPVDEAAVVRRYDISKWTIPQCSAAFGIGPQRVRDILHKHHVELRGRTRILEPADVIRAYELWGDYSKVARILGIGTVRVTDILDEVGIAHNSSRRVPPEGSRSRTAEARRAAWAKAER
jgi:hypothetical protein